jgi:hypothetical protein
MLGSRKYTVAAILAALLSLSSVISSLILLPRGSADLASEGDQPPYAIVIVALVLGAIGVVAAYGVFRVQRWGIILTLIVMVLNVLSGLPGVPFGPTALAKVSSAVQVVVAGAVIWLLLRRDARKLASADAGA